MFAGLMATIFYVGYPVYVNNISNPSNRTTFFGVGYSIFLGSMIVGNLAGYYSFLLKAIFYFLCLVSLIFCAIR